MDNIEKIDSKPTSLRIFCSSCPPLRWSVVRPQASLGGPFKGKPFRLANNLQLDGQVIQINLCFLCWDLLYFLHILDFRHRESQKPPTGQTQENEPKRTYPFLFPPNSISKGAQSKKNQATSGPSLFCPDLFCQAAERSPESFQRSSQESSCATALGSSQRSQEELGSHGRLVVFGEKSADHAEHLESETNSGQKWISVFFSRTLELGFKSLDF